MQSCFWPRAKDPKVGPAFEENLALIQTIFGENSRAISTLAGCYKRHMAGFTTEALYAGAFKARSALGSFARRSRFPKTLRGKAAVNPPRVEVLGNHRRQSQQSRLELGLGLNCGFSRANNLDCCHIRLELEANQKLALVCTLEIA